MRSGIQLEGKRVLVVGLARTGLATALFCAKRGATVTATDTRSESEICEIAAKLGALGVRLELGGHHQETFIEQDLIIPSPGVPANLPALAAAQNKGVAIWSEVELASRFLSGRLVGITGSNGKTTTTALTAHILEQAKFATILAGNIGTPLISRVEETTDSSVTVIELSSFQLELIRQFRPDVSVLLNLTPDHLDRHGSLEAYGRMKARIFENQTERDAAVLNADDPRTPSYAPALPQIFWFSRIRRVSSGAYLRGEDLVFRRDGADITVLRRSDILLRGAHNVENVLAAVAAAHLAGAPQEAIAAGVRSFPGVEHRLEFAGEVCGVSYYNDSKATNVDATLKAIDAFPGRLLVILGGKDKGSDYAPLRSPLKDKAVAVFLIGAAADKIARQIEGAVPIERVGTLDRAVHLATDRARPGDTVLLAPACASFDQFDNYEHRGRVFKKLVREIMQQAAPDIPVGTNNHAPTTGN
ncbi:MAG TPA: UDP-N-acetylmuramoyl-L-alanine--D-glutamate ligase [Candidatus Dormibacteraeota bacterium]|nr:UDP-N-acetylmuramoyl-L-alanine--D-glutamate ligase [Candidatus Dormibacteraeota bacterium]